jgi:lysine 2,3-aminomutase
MEELFKRISPLAIPYYAVDGPGGYGKVLLMPERYKKEGNRYIFRSFNGKLFEMADR